MVGVSFIPFPKPKTNCEHCKAWIKACGRKIFTIDNITRNTYVCSKHFHNGQPSELYPDPYPAQSSQMLQEMQPKRLPPKQQTQISLKKPKFMVDDKEISSTNELSLKKCQLMVDDKKISSTNEPSLKKCQLMVDDKEISSTNESSLKKCQLMVDDKEISSTLLQNSLVLSNEPSLQSNLIGPSEVKVNIMFLLFLKAN